MKTLILGTLAVLIWMVNGALLSGCSTLLDTQDRRVTIEADCDENTVKVEGTVQESKDHKEVNSP